MRWVFDTGVWLHYASVPAVQKAADEVRKGSTTEVLAAPVSIAEVLSVLSRRGAPAEGERLASVILEASRVPDLEPESWKAAGRIHAAERRRHPDLSLADALILAFAQQERARLLTTDHVLANNAAGVRARLVKIR